MITGIPLATQLQNIVNDKVAPGNANCFSYYCIGHSQHWKDPRHTVWMRTEQGQLSSLAVISIETKQLLRLMDGKSTSTTKSLMVLFQRCGAWTSFFSWLSLSKVKLSLWFFFNWTCFCVCYSLSVWRQLICYFKHNLITAASEIVNKLLCRVHMSINLIVMRSVPHQPRSSLHVTEVWEGPDRLSKQKTNYFWFLDFIPNPEKISKHRFVFFVPLFVFMLSEEYICLSIF